MSRMFLLVLVIITNTFGAEGRINNDERSIRDLINQWDAAYRHLDAKSLAQLETPDFELVNRLGQWMPFKSREDNVRMWAWAFTNIYHGKSGPQHSVERVRFIRTDIAIVQARASWPDEITLPDGTRIPPHGEIDTFVVVKQKEGWRIASQNIHNQMPGEELPAQLPWEN